jgi:hypothetical protein
MAAEVQMTLAEIKAAVVDQLVIGFEQRQNTLTADKARAETLLNMLGLPSLAERRKHVFRDLGISVVNDVQPPAGMSSAYALQATEQGIDLGAVPVPAVERPRYVVGAGLDMASLVVACNAFQNCWTDLCYVIQHNRIPLPETHRDVVERLGHLMADCGANAADMARVFCEAVLAHVQPAPVVAKADDVSKAV